MFKRLSILQRIKKYMERNWKIRQDIVGYYRGLGVRIGERCIIHRLANFGSEPYLVSLGDHVRVNKGVEFVTHDGGMWVFRETVNGGETITLFGCIVVGDNVHIGTNAIIMPGVRIGNNCVIGCGAVVTHDVPDNTVAAGVPARIIETVDEYYAKNYPRFDHTYLMNENELKDFLLLKYCRE